MFHRGMKGVLAALCGLLMFTASAAAAPVTRGGYVRLSDGTPLRYTLALPAATGRFAPVLVYGPYGEGNGVMRDPGAQALLAHGYAVLGVSVRGTACSGGRFDLLSDQQWRDGSEVVEWAARQSWSTGHVGMWGISYPGMTQIGTAATRPPHLDAIAPWNALGSSYRDVSFPGGIFNRVFGVQWAVLAQPELSFGSSLTDGILREDQTCLANLAQHADTGVNGETFAKVKSHPYMGAFWATHSPATKARRIAVPDFQCDSFDDDQVTFGTFLHSVWPRRRASNTWNVIMNGPHGACGQTVQTRTVSMLVDFFDRFLKGDAGAFAGVPHIQVWHETQFDATRTPVPRWTTTWPSWRAVRPRPLKLYLGAHGTLGATAPRTADARSRYRYPAPSAGTEDSLAVGQTNLLWKRVPRAGSALAYTTAPLAQDVSLFGTGSVDLWLASTARDTDVQAMLTEVRPDGQEVYVQSGWLRASARRIDPAQSTALEPFQTYTRRDRRALTPRKPTAMRLRLLPVSHTFRAGSSIRLWLSGPSTLVGGWGLDYLRTPSVDTVLAGRRHASSLVLGVVPGTAQGTPLPACDTVLNEPCRRNPVPVPAGSLAVSRG